MLHCALPCMPSVDSCDRLHMDGVCKARNIRLRAKTCNKSPQSPPKKRRGREILEVPLAPSDLTVDALEDQSRMIKTPGSAMCYKIEAK